MNNNERSSGSGLGCFSSVFVLMVFYIVLSVAFGASFIVACFQLGPFDAFNTISYECMGEMPLAKKRIIEYCRTSIKEKNPDLTIEQINKQIADELGIELIAGKYINPQKISSIKLWDLAEDHAQTLYDRWIATPLLHSIEKEQIKAEGIR